MKILMLTPYLPYPLLSGGQTRSYNLLKNLARDHDITLFSFIRTNEEKKYRAELLKYCKKVEVFVRRPAWSLINVFLAASSPYPFLVAIYLSQNVKKALSFELDRNKYDLIHAETFYVMPNIPKTRVPVLLVEQTIEYRVYQHFVQQSVPNVLKPLLWLDVWKVRFWEKFFWRKADRVVAMSEADKEKMLRVLPNLTVDVVPNGVDMNSFQAKKRAKATRPTILYVGNFKWLQNREAAIILMRDIWPKIKKKMPNARLRIVGRGLGEDLKKWRRDDMVFDEHVDDIRNIYQEADIMLAPIKGPGGTRLKILEAMASGCPVLTTPVGIEGIAAKNGTEVLVGNTSEDLAKLAVDLLNDPAKRKSLTNHAMKLVHKKYNWLEITQKLEGIYQEVGYGKTY